MDSLPFGDLMKAFRARRKISQLESWDSKPSTTFGGPFRAIPTSVPGIHVSELLPRTAKLMHHLAIVRSLAAGARPGWST